MRSLVSIAILTMLLAATGCGPAADNRGPDQLLVESQAQLKSGNSAAAIELSQSALRTLRQRHAPVRKIALAEAVCADAQFAANKTAEGVRDYRAALATAENLFIARKIEDTKDITGELVRVGKAHQIDHAELVPALVLYGNANREARMLIDAQHAWEEAIECGPEKADPKRTKFAAAMFALSDTYEEREQRQNADALYKNAVKWCSQDPELVKAMVAEADYQMTLEKFACKQLLVAILPAVESNAAVPKEIVYELWRKIGIIHAASDEHPQSIAMHQKLLAFCEKDPKTSPKELRGVLENLSGSEFKIGKWAESREHFRRLAQLCRTSSPPDISSAESFEHAIKMADIQISAAKKKPH